MGTRAASALFFRDTARQAVALLMFRDMVMRPRKGDFAFCLWSAQILCGSFCFLFVEHTDFVRFIFAFYIQGHSTNRPAPETKKRWGPALGLWQGLVALARAKLRKQQIKIRPHKEKQSQQSKHRTNKTRCIAKSRKSKSRMQKKKQ